MPDSHNNCQLFDLLQISEPLKFFDILWQIRNRIKRIFKRRWRYFINVFCVHLERKKKLKNDTTIKSNPEIKRGDLVQVRSKQEIKETLNRWNQLRGCGFMEEMWRYCGTIQRVHKRVEKFLDERDYHLKKVKGILLLKDVFCEGTKDFGSCDRSCFYFWREEWLEKIN